MKTPSNPSHRHKAGRGRFYALLGLLLGMLLLAPLVPGLAVRIALLLLPIAVLYAVSRNRVNLEIACALIAPVMVGGLLAVRNYDVRIFSATTVLAGIFLAYGAFVIVSEVARARVVTFETISGGVCGYLLIGATFGLFYAAVLMLDPSAFHFSFPLPPSDDLLVRSHPLLMTYFSFVTLTSIGFGDITPLAGFVRSLTVMEAMTGAFYIAIFIARLVSLQTVQAVERAGELASGK